ncbi:nicotinic acid mononucleotide adenyltransferase [Hyunsoonleella sp. SJ7]|uniref:Nicotinic acid mononucleotide adenyltransferase n=1 Tax=Hyunsoonleella aquatilis TaxID=2762758 RepID=A0A923HDI3_9FLAO|nr:nicotinic acid mononucleotide adenyltransferase [Hyunsoonleella aquatilis]MBC3758143.1 nicotinic acid mononucleotide adenyltransferase [Hyunsoonleella aquatilis]
MKKYIIILAVLFVGASAFAQKERTLTLNKETNLIDVVYFHDNGEISQTGSYTADGKLEGEWIKYDKEGAKIVTAYYKEGKKVGKWVYVVDGKLKEVDYSKNVASL